MKINMADLVVAEGDPAELAFYTCLVLTVLKDKNDKDKQQEVKNWLEKYGDKTFEELMRMERDEEE